MDARTAFEKTLSLFSTPYVAASIIILGVPLLVFWILVVTSGGVALQSVLFAYPGNTFMDFYNVIYIASTDPYHNGGIYPPLAYCAYYVIGLIALPELETPIYINNFDIKLTQTGEMCLFMFFAIAVFMIYKGSQKVLGCKDREKDLLFLILLLSPTMLFTIERANINLITVGLMLCFVACYRSEDKYCRYMAVIFLALATCTKVYVAVYGLLLCKKDRLHELFIFIVLTITLNTVPFLFIGGDPVTYINNLLHWASISDESWISPTSPGLADMLYVLDENTNMAIDSAYIAKILKYLILCLTPILVFFSGNGFDWKNMALLSIMMILIGGNLGGYYQIYLIPAFLMFLNENRTPTVFGLIYLCLFIFMFICLPNYLFNYEYYYLTSKLAILGTASMYILLMGDRLIGAINTMKKLLFKNRGADSEAL